MIKESLSVIIVKYKEPIEVIKECIDSLENQKNVKLEIIFLDQKKSTDVHIKLNRRSVHELKYIEIPDISLSFARNYGMEIASNDYVAFIDPDAVAKNDWALNIIREFKKDDSVGIIGGKILPRFSGKLRWYHKSPYVLSVYSLLDLGPKSKYVKRIVGANFAINMKLIKDERFREDLGRRNGKLSGGEETDFCERIARKGIKIKYVPNVVVYHNVSKERLRIWWILRRFYYGGISRGVRGGKPEPFEKQYTIRNLLPLFIFIIPYLIGFVQGKLQKLIKKE